MSSPDPLTVPGQTPHAPPGHLTVLIIVGPHGGQDLPADLVGARAGVRVQRRDAASEDELVAVLATPADAIVLDAGSLEHYSHRTAEALEGLTVPVVIARGRHEPALAAREVVMPAARGSIVGGGALAYDAAVQAAAQLAGQAQARER